MLPTFKTLIFAENTFHEIKYRGNLFSRIQELEYFAWIYFHGWWNFNNPAWIFLRYCKMCHMDILRKEQTFAILKQIFYGRCIKSIIRHYS